VSSVVLWSNILAGPPGFLLGVTGMRRLFLVLCVLVGKIALAGPPDQPQKIKPSAGLLRWYLLGRQRDSNE
jgi:hypothetical protein